MTLSIYTKGRYKDLCGFGRQKNKANSKPNKANQPAVGRKSKTSRAGMAWKLSQHDLQSTIWKNKANLADVEMNAKSIMTSGYEK